MDVIEHIADDRGELGRPARLLGPGAVLDTFLVPLSRVRGPIVGSRLGKSVLGISRKGVEAASPAA